MRRAIVLFCYLWTVAFASAAQSQESWIQIEALPTLAEGEERARAYGGVFPNVHGFELTSGWYAIVLGPFDPAEAIAQLDLLRAERMIPADSYIPDPGRFERRFWPAGAAQPSLPSADGAPEPLVAVPLPDEADPAVEPEETPREARVSEGRLSSEARQELQTALQWEGFYAGKIDGAIGAGTRASMAAWQASRGLDETGILTTRQRDQLVSEYRSEVASIGLGTITEVKAGIEIAIPRKLVAFKGYQPPFVQFDETNGSGFQVLLISQSGDETTLYGLYDLMQTLKIVPLEGERERKRTSFVLTGKNDTIQSYTQAELSGGFIKGFTLAWRPEDGARAMKVLEAMKASFRPVGEEALDDSLGEPLGTTREDLLAGLEVRRPLLSRSGFYISAAGKIVTTVEAVEKCGRVTIDGTTEAEVTLRDTALGFAVLTPKRPLSPKSAAAFRTEAPRSGAEVAVAGYPYEDSLSAPVVTFGTLAEAKGLQGEPNLNRLSLKSQPGDSGGPVLDTSGSVVGMLLPKMDDGSRILPGDVVFALSSGAIAEALTLSGDTPEPSIQTGAIAAEDVAAKGRDLTVLISCWE